LYKSAFERLRESLRGTSTRTEELAPELIIPAQTLLGTIGFITWHVRADACFAYSVLARFASPERLTKFAFRCIVRLAHYIVATKDLSLHLTPPKLITHPNGDTCLDLFSTYVDSSHGNWTAGGGFGGYVLATDRDPSAPPGSFGGGALAWGCWTKHCGDDSSAAAELRMAVDAYKQTLVTRFIQTELLVGAAPSRPTPFYMDASAIVDGFECERLSRASRWMAIRYGMLRWGVACSTIKLTKLDADDNPADANTKCLVGPAFIRSRNLLLGYPNAPAI
jgi:hypothetical protein